MAVSWREWAITVRRGKIARDGCALHSHPGRSKAQNMNFSPNWMRRGFVPG